MASRMDPSDADPLERGRSAFQARRWSEALTLLEEADAISPLAPADFESLAVARFLHSGDPEGLAVWEDAHHELLARGDVPRAALAAFWLGMHLANRGEAARGAGWIARASHLLDESGVETAVRGYLLIPSAIEAAVAGDLPTALRISLRVQEIGRQFADADLVTLARHGEGRMRLRSGQVAEGLAILDELMVTITSGGLSPLIVGLVYCSVVEVLSEVYDVARQREWTAQLDRWCEAQPDLQLYRGECMIHRAAVLQLRGRWDEALAQARAACSRFLGPPAHVAAGAAFYQEAELHRLAGRQPEAEVAYLKAAELGRGPQPGLALLRLAQGRVDAAEGAIRRALAERADPVARVAILPAYVEIMVAAGDLPAARAALDELAGQAAGLRSDYLNACAAQAEGALLLASDELGPALIRLREAARLWLQLDAAYQLAQVRQLIGLACRDLGDEEGAGIELSHARQGFERLGATRDLRRAEAMEAKRRSGHAGGLTGREVELLSLLATGKTNREIAERLFISEKTVARHVSNIFNKLGVSSRAAATAYAFKHDLA